MTGRLGVVKAEKDRGYSERRASLTSEVIVSPHVPDVDHAGRQLFKEVRTRAVPRASHNNCLEAHVKLYFKSGACSLSPHIVLREAALPFELVAVDFKTGKAAGGEDFKKINPKGYVPTLQLDDGQVLTEGVAIVQYLADRKPEAQLAPKAGTLERYRLIEWLNYIATELHKGTPPANSPPEVKDAVREARLLKYGFVAEHLAQRQFLLGERFTVADAYLFTVLTWSKPRGIELERWPALKAYFDRIATRPAVREALAAERA